MRAIARRGEEGAIAALQHYLTQVAAGIGGALPLNFFVQLSLLLALLRDWGGVITTRTS